jgi:hypothetical protein
VAIEVREFVGAKFTPVKESNTLSKNSTSNDKTKKKNNSTKKTDTKKKAGK